MKIVRRKLWSRFWGLVALVAVLSCATALALAYEPNVVRGVRVLGSFLERIPVQPRRKASSPAPVTLAPVAPPPVPAEPLAVPALQEPGEAPKVEPIVQAAPAASGPAAPPEASGDEAASEEWDEADELHSDEDEMPVAPDETP